MMQVKIVKCRQREKKMRNEDRVNASSLFIQMLEQKRTTVPCRGHVGSCLD